MDTPEAEAGEPPVAGRAAPLSSSSRAPGAPPATRPDPAAESEAGGESEAGSGGARSPLRPPPGWYADPAGGDRSRWWDGGSWTDRTRAGRGGPPDPGLLHT